MVNMQFTKWVVCDTSKSSLYTSKRIKSPLVGEHIFPLTGFVCSRLLLSFSDSSDSSCSNYAKMLTVENRPMYANTNPLSAIRFCPSLSYTSYVTLERWENGGDEFN